jgi:hypothetical protein
MSAPGSGTVAQRDLDELRLAIFDLRVIARSCKGTVCDDEKAPVYSARADALERIARHFARASRDDVERLAIWCEKEARAHEKSAADWIGPRGAELCEKADKLDAVAAALRSGASGWRTVEGVAMGGDGLWIVVENGRHYTSGGGEERPVTLVFRDRFPNPSPQEDGA